MLKIITCTDLILNMILGDGWHDPETDELETKIKYTRQFKKLVEEEEVSIYLHPGLRNFIKISMEEHLPSLGRVRQEIKKLEQYITLEANISLTQSFEEFDDLNHSENSFFDEGLILVSAKLLEVDAIVCTQDSQLILNEILELNPDYFKYFKIPIFNLESFLNRLNQDYRITSKFANSEESIFTKTPGGIIVELLPGSTPIDFACSLHIQFVNNYRSALVNGNTVLPNQSLRSGDTVEIIRGEKNEIFKVLHLNPNNYSDIEEILKTYCRKKFTRKAIKKAFEKEYQRLGWEIINNNLNKKQRKRFEESCSSGEFPKNIKSRTELVLNLGLGLIQIKTLIKKIAELDQIELEQNLEGFMETFERSGLLLDDDRPNLYLDDEAIADMLWLAAQIKQKTPNLETVETPPTPPRPLEDNGGDRQSPVRNSNTGGSTSENTAPPPTADITSSNEQSRLEERSPEVGSLPIRVPKAPTFLNKLQVRRAFRPLRRKVPSKRNQILDIDQTVEAIAEKLIFGQEIWTVVTKPDRERWLDVELVIEETESGMIWQEMIAEFQQILETHGAFRQLRIWNLKADDAGLVLQPRYRGDRRKRKHHPKELCHPEQRGMILFVSDCTSDLWETGKIFAQLREWSKTTTLGVVQLFPEHRWQSTWLNKGRKFFAKSGGMGALNSQLKLMDVPKHLQARVKSKQDLFLPILTMESDMVYQWSRILSGNAAGRIPVYLVRRSQFSSSPESPAIENQSTAELTPEAQVNIFRATALPISQQLAGLMSAVPVDISVVNLIRQTLLQKAEPQHVAEVFMGGLMVADSQNPGQYDFALGVRKILNGLMRQDQLLNVLDVLSEKIGEELDRPIGSFMALLTLLPSYSEQEQQKILPFARVSVEVLTNLGGEYATFAKQVKRVLPAAPLTDGELLEYEFETAVFKEKEVDPEIEWKTLEFETVDLIVEEGIENVTFEFETAKYVGEELQRETKTTEGFIEILREGHAPEEMAAYEGEEELEARIDLDMVRIPAGTFVMGAPESDKDSNDNERPQHLVTVPEFYLGRFLVTQEQWREVANWEQVDRELNPEPSQSSDENYPVDRVSWEDAQEFCARLSQKTERQYRLLSEAEWEYACRAIANFQSSVTGEERSPKEEQSLIQEWNENYYQPYSYGDRLSPKVAIYSSDSTVAVGSFPANGFGLYDMHGNLYEWCEDDWHEDYKNAPDDGSAWLENGETSRRKTIRGGAWSNAPWGCRSAYRYDGDRDSRSGYIRFRVACSLPGVP